MNTFSNFFSNILLKPFRNHFIFLVVFFVLATTPYIFRQFFTLESYFYSIILSIHCLILSYFVTFLIGLIKPDIVKTAIQFIIIIISAISFALNFYCVFKLGYLFDSDFAMLILDTNIKESKEFITSMIPSWIFASVICTYIALIVLFLLSKRYNLNLKPKTSYIAIVIMGFCLIENIYSWRTWEDGPIKSWFELPKFDSPYSLESYYTHPIINIIEKDRVPPYVVLIIGESFTRSHCSLYNYNKETNPHLKTLKNDNYLFSFDSIISPATTTAESIKLLMSTFSKNDTIHDKKWYEYTSLIELMQVCGYDCYWISNQARGSKYNGIARSYAQACKAQWFLQEEGSERNSDVHKSLDIVLVDSSYHILNNLDSKRHFFFIYHMEGSHFDYSKRYTKEFNFFHEQDYTNHPQEHRSILATYDNSILYNDYVVAQIINLYKNKEAIVVYVPDHGQVMYRNPKDPNYYVHGNNNDPYSYALGVDIPFIIYTSPAFQEKHPDIVKRIKHRQDYPKSWNTDDLPYFIMDLIGVKEINGENIQCKSIIN